MSIRITIIAVFIISLASNYANAGLWKPLCADFRECTAPYDVSLGGGAGGYDPIDRHAAGPLVTQTGFLLQMGTPILWRPNEETGDWEYPGGDDPGNVFSNLNAVTLSNGNMVRLTLYGRISGLSHKYLNVEIRSPDNKTIYVDSWNDYGIAKPLLNAALIAPTITDQDTIYVGIRGGGFSTVYHSTDGGYNWQSKTSSIRIGDDRFNLLPNPENTDLWAIESEFFDEPASLWESTDHGGVWSRIDDGSFPAKCVRVIHDPSNSGTSYALTDHGLYISTNRGVSWEATALTEAVHGLAIVDRKSPLSRAFIVGTDAGLKVSVNETDEWQSMSGGLPAVPYTVDYRHGVLMASGDSGLFTCNAIDCFGEPIPLPPKTPSGIVMVTEFYNTDLDHYFITASEPEKQAIDSGGAGANWIRTGQEFAAWNLLVSKNTTNVCRFYGSQNPGPNSHFFSISANECSYLIDLQLTTPPSTPRWNLEGYAFAATPAIPAIPQQDNNPPRFFSCPKYTKPIYRYYNNGFSQGKDSNHRYLSDPKLIWSGPASGWEYEGIAFCVPG